VTVTLLFGEVGETGFAGHDLPSRSFR